MRRRIFLSFAFVVVGVLGLLVGTVYVATRTVWGRGKIIELVTNQVSQAVKGRLLIGQLDGSLFTGFTLDTLELRDRHDSLFIAVGGLEVSYDPRDLLDRRILMHRVRMRSLNANLFEDSVGQFNFRRIFESDQPPGPPPAPSSRRSWGHFVLLEDVVIDSLNLQLSTRWNPSDLLAGAARDSVIRFNLEREDKDIWRGPGVWYETRRWTHGHIELDSARIDDKQPAGRMFAIRTASIDESDPPFRFRNARGLVRIQGDSIWPDIEHFELPGSRGSLTGKVCCWNGRPAAFDLAVTSDSVSLADVAWVYPTLPTTGGGRMDLRIRSESDPRFIDYVLSNMDVRSTDSRLRGAMTFVVGSPTSIVKDVDLNAQPLDFTLIETLAGEPLPYPWRGQITGTLLASGGPLDDWMVDEADLVFRDANVPGAVTIGKAQGRMNILEPSEVVFNGLNVHLDQLDLRTLQFLVPTFPKLNGMVAGRAILDSLWTDVRFREADITHTDGSGPATRLLGAGRVTFADAYTAYDVALNAQPFSFTTFSRAYTDSHIPLQGEYSGPMRLFGTTQDLAVTTQLQGPAGLIGYDGRVDGDSLGGYGLDGTLTFAGVDLRTLLDTAITPVTDLWGRATLNVTFDSLLTTRGTTTIDIDRNSHIDSVLVYSGSRSRLRFTDGVAQVIEGDTIRLEAGQLVARGGIGLGAGFRDSLIVDARLDSLGGLRPYLNVAVDDTLRGTMTARVSLVGSLDTLGVVGNIRGQGLSMPGLQAAQLRVDPNLTDVLGAMGGTLTVGADQATLGGVRFALVVGGLTLEDGRSGAWNVLADAINGSTVISSGRLGFAGDTTAVRIDTLQLRLDGNRYRLERPALVRMEPERTLVDTLTLVGVDNARVSFAADAPELLPMRARLGADRVSLRDLTELFQTDVTLQGEVSGSLDITGTRDAPRMTAEARMSGLTSGDLRVAGVSLAGEYADRRITGRGEISQADTTVLTVQANVPYDLTLRSRETRQLDDTMRVSIRSPDVDLGMLETFTSAVRDASGTFAANLDLVGPARAATLNGSLAITNGRATLPGMGITLRDMHARISARRDTLHVDSLFMVSGPERDDVMTLRGWIAHPLTEDSVAFDLAARAAEFHAIGLEREIADLTIDANVTWRGTSAASRADGEITVQKGSIALPESSDKDLFSVENWAALGLDSTDVSQLGLLPSQASIFLRGLEAENVRIAMGPDVWLKSEDALIKLAGAVNLRVCRATVGCTRRDIGFDDAQAGRLSEDLLVLTGDLQTERGTYRLNVSPFQRTFFVEGGQLRFDGSPGFNPLLDIRAVYTSRQIETNYGGRNDVRVGAHITGTLVNPELSLYSADSLSFLSETDLWSYVLFNQPSFTVGRADLNFGMSLLFGTVSSWASSAASRLAGGFVDYVQLQTRSQGSVAGDQRLFGGGLLEGAQLGVGRQFGDRYFVTATSGLCQFRFDENFLNSLQNIGSAVGLKVEYRFGPRSPAGLSASYEPSFNKLVCNGTGNIGFTSERKQFGLDLFRVWRR